MDSLAGVILDIFNQLGIELNEDQRAQVDQLVQNVTDGFVNGTIDSNDVLNTLVDGISDILGYTEDWFNPTPVTTSYVIQNDIYESMLRAAVTDCQGNAIEGAEYIVKDGSGSTVEVAEGGTTVIYDTYTLEVTAVPDGYVLDDSASVLEVFAGENNGNYTLQAVYHLEKDSQEIAPTRGKNGQTAGTVCEYCGKVLSGCEEIPALGVQITVEGSELGTVTLNGEAVTYGEANKVALPQGIAAGLPLLISLDS